MDVGLWKSKTKYIDKRYFFSINAIDLFVIALTIVRALQKSLQIALQIMKHYSDSATFASHTAFLISSMLVPICLI